MCSNLLVMKMTRVKLLVINDNESCFMNHLFYISNITIYIVVYETYEVYKILCDL